MMNLHRKAVVVINNMVPNLGCDSFIYLHLLVLICNIIMHLCRMFCFVDANNRLSQGFWFVVDI